MKRILFESSYIFLSILCFKVENHIIKFLDDELTLFKAFVSDVEDGVFVSGFIVHIEDDVSFGDGDDVSYVFGFGADSVFADGNVHIGGIFLKYFYGAQRLKVFDALGFEGVAVVAFEEPRSQVVFGDAGVVFFRFDYFAGEFNSLILLALEIIDVDHTAVDQHTNCVTV
jgi:hypothetical protein